MSFRGASVEDLQLPPPLPLYTDTCLADARELVLDQIPSVPPVAGVLSRPTGRLAGYLDGAQLESELADDPSQIVVDHMHHLELPTRVALDAPLENLVSILRVHPIAEVTDSSDHHVLAIVTAHDLARRGIKLL